MAVDNHLNAANPMDDSAGGEQDVGDLANAGQAHVAKDEASRGAEAEQCDLRYTLLSAGRLW